jgi:hypothetical protein
MELIYLCHFLFFFSHSKINNFVRHNRPKQMYTLYVQYSIGSGTVHSTIPVYPYNDTPVLYY